MERENREERQMVIKFDTEAMVDILKRHTLPEEAVSIEKLTEKMCEVYQADFSERTVRRRMEQFLAVQNNPDERGQEAAKMFYRMFGGRVEYTTAPGIQQGKRSKGTTETQRYYYFEPCLDEASMDMLNGLIISNPFLAGQEKNYLLERLQMLNVPAGEGVMREDGKAVQSRREQALPGEKERLLKTVGVLHYAIQMGYRVCVKYGIYDTSGVRRGQWLDFHARREEPYVLDPYAMLWNRGYYYLIATVDAYEKPTHFRIDRILEIRIAMKKKRKGDQEPERRRPVPELLKPFWKGKRFDAKKYVHTYPSMRIFGEPRLLDCSFECTPVSLQILVDAFGTDIRVKDSPILHSGEEKNAGDRPRKYLKVEIKKVQYENARDFAVHYADSLTLLEPAELVEEVRDKIGEIRDRFPIA